MDADGVQCAGHTTGCDQFAGDVGHTAAADPGEGDGHLPGAQGLVYAVLWCVKCHFANKSYILIPSFFPIDEIIRQVTINCTERGLLLMRMRDEIAMSMEAYETLYCSSVAFGLRKALQAQEGKEALHERVASLEVSKHICLVYVFPLTAKSFRLKKKQWSIC